MEVDKASNKAANMVANMVTDKTKKKKVSDMELVMVADMEVDMVADINIDIYIDIIGPKLFRSEAFPAWTSSKLWEFICL